MRVALALSLGCAALAAACTSQPNRVSSTPPSVSYRVAGDNVSDTAVEAQNYCSRFGHAPQYRGVQSEAEGNVAVYTCDGVQTPAAPAGSTVPPGPPTVIAPGPAQ
jgi:hypothetical protein